MRARLLFFVSLLVASGCSETATTAGANFGGGGAASGTPASGAGGSAPAGGVSGGGAGSSGVGVGAAGAGAAGAAAGTASGGAAGSGGAAQGPQTLGELYCPPAQSYPNPLADAPEPAVVAIAPPGGISFLEGPVWLAQRGVLLLSEWNDQHRILQLTPPTMIEVFSPMSRSNGLIVTPDGTGLLMATENPTASISRMVLADKDITPLVEEYQGQGFVQPNDLTTRVDQTIFFTDYQAGRLYRLTSGGAVELLASLPQANGVALSPDEQTLYLNAGERTVAYPLARDSTIGEGQDLATDIDGADGLAIDCAGNVYIAENEGGSLVVVSPTGEPLGEFNGLPQTVTNAAFGGAERKTLYITTSSALYSVELPIPGLPF